MHSYYYELAKGRMKEWHEEGDQDRRARLVKANKRRGRRPTVSTETERRLSLPPTPALDDLAQR